MENEVNQYEEMEMEKLKSELHDMVERVMDYWNTRPDLLTKVLMSYLAAPRPIQPSTLQVAASTGSLLTLHHTTVAKTEKNASDQAPQKTKHMETEEDLREEIMEVEKLQSEVHQMAQRVQDYRKTMPDHLIKVLSSLMAAQRPILPPMLEVDTSKEVQLKEEGLDEMIKKFIFREKSERNLSAIPVKLKRLKECIQILDEIEQIGVDVHPILKIKL